MTATATLIDPADILPPHEVTDADKLADLTESMRQHGWQGAPVVIHEHQDSQALTGSHRIAAALAAEISIPTIDIADLVAEHGGSWEDMVDDFAESGSDLPWYEAACRLSNVLPVEVIEHYGIDIN